MMHEEGGCGSVHQAPILHTDTVTVEWGSGGREDRMWLLCCAVLPGQQLCNLLVDSAHEQDPTQKKRHEQERLFRTSYSDPQPTAGCCAREGSKHNM
jgi:hypothetical protein